MKFTVLILLITFTTALQAQQNRYPSATSKLITIQKDFFGDADYKRYSKNGELQQEGELSEQRLKIAAVIPLYSKNQFSITTALSYTRSNLSYYHKETSGLFNKSTFSTDDFDAALSGMYRATLFNKPMVNTATVVLGSSNFFNPKKMTGLLSSSLVLKATATTLTTIGIAVNLDGSNLVPFFPLFSYWHKLNNSLLELDMVLPQRIMLRRPGIFNGWLSTGVELTNNSFFIKQEAEMQYREGNYEWNSNDINASVAYERFLGKKILVGLKGGYKSSLTTRLLKVNDKIDNYKSRTKIAAPFFNVNMGFVIK
jgi:hypothetical protein